MTEDKLESNRRPLTSRSSNWAMYLSRTLIRLEISPNSISVASIIFAVAGTLSLICLTVPAGLLVMAACVQLRLVCNLLDGMVAIDGKRQSPTGGLYNEIPDRVADTVFIVGIGYYVNNISLGWYAALVAALTAYIRVLGGSLGTVQDFRGPMAKQHRMATVTIGSIAGAVEYVVNRSNWSMLLVEWIIAIGATVTCIARMQFIARQLNSKN